MSTRVAVLGTGRMGAAIGRRLAESGKIGGQTLKSIGDIARTQRVLDNEADFVEPSDMLAELCEDNRELVERLREAHNVCDEHGDVATTSVIETWIDESERRAWFLFESGRGEDATGH